MTCSFISTWRLRALGVTRYFLLPPSSFNWALSVALILTGWVGAKGPLAVIAEGLLSMASLRGGQGPDEAIPIRSDPTTTNYEP